MKADAYNDWQCNCNKKMYIKTKVQLIHWIVIGFSC